MKILGLDSSGLVASVALVEDENLLAEYTVNYKKTHSQTLLPMLDEIAAMTELDLKTIDAIAVAGGPGSFTGLRIGSATAKGLGLALEKPLISIPTVDGLAYNLWGARDLVCPLMDARRSQTYTGLYDFSGGDMDILISQRAVGIEEIIDTVNGFQRGVVFLGDGVPVFREAIRERCRVPYGFAPAHMNKQRASALASLALRYYEAGRVETAAEHRPDYLRLSQAEREQLKKEGKEQREVLIRTMLPEDAEEVSRLEQQIFSQPWSAQGFKDALSSDKVIFLVAEQGDKTVGYCGMYCAADEGEITNVAVAREARNRGIGGRLVKQLLDRAREAGIRNVILEVRLSNDSAIHLYKNLGFVISGIRKDFYEMPREDGYVMALSQ